MNDYMPDSLPRNICVHCNTDITDGAPHAPECKLTVKVCTKFIRHHMSSQCANCNLPEFLHPITVDLAAIEVQPALALPDAKTGKVCTKFIPVGDLCNNCGLPEHVHPKYYLKFTPATEVQPAPSDSLAVHKTAEGKLAGRKLPTIADVLRDPTKHNFTADSAVPLACSDCGQPEGVHVFRPLLGHQDVDEITIQSIINILQQHCGESGENEGGVETLQRIIRERDAYKAESAAICSLFGGQ